MKAGNMGIIKRNYLTVLLALLFIGTTVYYNAYIVSLGESYLAEEVQVKNLVLDIMCDISESDDRLTAMVDAASEIDTLKQRGVYCAAYDKDLKLVSVRTPLYDPNLDVLDDRDLRRDVRLQNRGKTTIYLEGNAEYGAHDMHVYFRWLRYGTDSATLIVLGMSRFAVETDYNAGLTAGIWIIGGAFVALSLFSVIPMIIRRKGGAKDD